VGADIENCISLPDMIAKEMKRFRFILGLIITAPLSGKLYRLVSYMAGDTRPTGKGVDGSIYDVLDEAHFAI
jgi:hypothetical protein